jgi:aspartate ammonia-lyase
MPGKVNPVIPEFVISSAHRVYANDSLISSLSGQGCLELNAYLPAIGHALLESVRLLAGMDRTLREHLFSGLTVNAGRGKERLLLSPSLTTALVPYIGYHKAALIAKEMKESGTDIFSANGKLGLLPAEKLEKVLAPENLLKLGYQVGELE